MAICSRYLTSSIQHQEVLFEKVPHIQLQNNSQPSCFHNAFFAVVKVLGLKRPAEPDTGDDAQQPDSKRSSTSTGRVDEGMCMGCGAGGGGRERGEV